MPARRISLAHSRNSALALRRNTLQQTTTNYCEQALNRTAVAESICLFTVRVWPGPRATRKLEFEPHMEQDCAPDTCSQKYAVILCVQLFSKVHEFDVCPTRSKHWLRPPHCSQALNPPPPPPPPAAARALPVPTINQTIKANINLI